MKELATETIIKKENKFDAIIIGGGESGCSCAVRLKMLGYKVCIIEERPELGGFYDSNNFGIMLFHLIRRPTRGEIQEDILSHKVPHHLNSSVYNVARHNNGYRVHFVTNDNIEHEYFSEKIVVASGANPITGGLRSSKNVLINPSQIANYSFTNKSVAVLGGNADAFENYAFIKQCKSPKEIHIYGQFNNHQNLKARAEYLETLGPIDLILYKGSLKIDDQSGIVHGKKYDVLVVLYGRTAHIPFLKHLKPELNTYGFLKINPETAETSLPGIYAIGEVASQPSYIGSFSKMPDATVAVKAIYENIEANRKLSFIFFKLDRKLEEAIQVTTPRLRASL